MVYLPGRTLARILIAVSACWVFLLLATQASSDSDAHPCSVCRAIAQEILESAADKLQTASTIDIGSRLKRTGGYAKKAYRDSDVFLSDVLEDVCRHMKNYAFGSGTWQKFQGFRQRTKGTPTSFSLSNLSLDAKKGSQLEHKCSYLMEKFESELEDALREHVGSTVGQDAFIAEICNVLSPETPCTSPVERSVPPPSEKEEL